MVSFWGSVYIYLELFTPTLSHSDPSPDPFARVVFLNQSQVTEKLEKTLCPTWDQTLIYEQLEIHGEATSIAEKPPEIIIELFDHDTFVSTCTLKIKK